MQKTTQKASILIWSIFLSIIISLAFISISTKINKNLKNNSNIQQNFNTNQNIENIIKSENPQSQQLSGGKYIDITNGTLHTESLEKNETRQLSFSGTALNNITIKVKNGGPVKYIYSVEGNFQEKNTVTGTYSFSGNLNTVNNNSELNIENLGGYSLIEVTADTKIYGGKQYYDIWKKIGNKNVLIRSGEIN